MTNNLLNTQRVLARYSISRSTLHRWRDTENFGFPKPGYIHGRPYWKLHELNAFDETHFQTDAA